MPTDYGMNKEGVARKMPKVSMVARIKGGVKKLAAPLFRNRTLSELKR